MNSQMTDLARAPNCGARGASGSDASSASSARPSAHRIELSASTPSPPPASFRSSRRERTVGSLPQLSLMVSILLARSRPALNQGASGFEPPGLIDVDELTPGYERCTEIGQGFLEIG